MCLRARLEGAIGSRDSHVLPHHFHSESNVVVALRAKDIKEPLSTNLIGLRA